MSKTTEKKLNSDTLYFEGINYTKIRKDLEHAFKIGGNDSFYNIVSAIYLKGVLAGEDTIKSTLLQKLNEKYQAAGFFAKRKIDSFSEELIALLNECHIKMEAVPFKDAPDSVQPES